jgi:hypothetical protein
MTGKRYLIENLSMFDGLQADGGEGQVGEEGEHHGGRGEER